MKNPSVDIWELQTSIITEIEQVLNALIYFLVFNPHSTLKFIFLKHVIQIIRQWKPSNKKTNS